MAAESGHEHDPRVRLHKVLARAGVASRRRCEELMAHGRVEVDGEVVTRLGAKVDPEHAVIRVDGQRLPTAAAHVYLVANKPRGMVSSMADESGRSDLRALVRDRPERLFHVGRLDTDTEGLLLLTNDGEFAHRMTHPSYGVRKTYLAQVEGVVRAAVRRRLLEGVTVDGRTVEVHSCTVTDTAADRSMVELSIHEGRNRIVRRLLDEVGHPVLRLCRTAIGPVRLDTLAPGQVRPLRPDELGPLLDLLGL